MEKEHGFKKRKLATASAGESQLSELDLSPESFRRFLQIHRFKVRSADEILKQQGGRPLAYVKVIPFIINRDSSIEQFLEYWVHMDKKRDSCRNAIAAITGAPGTGKTRFLAYIQEMGGKDVTDSPQRQRAWDLTVKVATTFSSDQPYNPEDERDIEASLAFRLLHSYFVKITDYSDFPEFMSLLRKSFPYEGPTVLKMATQLIKKDYWMLLKEHQKSAVEESEVGALFLVDELLKIPSVRSRTDLLTGLGKLLDCGLAQTLVSSSNPEKLTETASDRDIWYIDLPPLCPDAFFKRLLMVLQERMKVDAAAELEYRNLTKSSFYANLIFRHACGHPRSLELLLDALSDANYDVDSLGSFERFKAKYYTKVADNMVMLQCVVLALEGEPVFWNDRALISGEKKSFADLVEMSDFANALTLREFVPSMPLLWLYRFSMSRDTPNANCRTMRRLIAKLVQFFFNCPADDGSHRGEFFGAVVSHARVVLRSMYLVRQLFETGNYDYIDPPLDEGKVRKLSGFNEFAFVAPVLNLAPTEVSHDFPSHDFLAELTTRELQQVFYGKPGNTSSGFDILEFHKSSTANFIVAYFSECELSLADPDTVCSFNEMKNKFFITMRKVVDCYGNEEHKKWMRGVSDGSTFWSRFSELGGFGSFEVSVDGVRKELQVRFAVWAFRNFRKPLCPSEEFEKRSIAVLDSDAILELLPPTLRGIPLLDMGKK